MATGEFEVSGGPAPGLLHGHIYATVMEHGGATPTNIIRSDQAWGVDFTWDLHGTLVPMICGYWCLHVCLESVGPGQELKLPDSIPGAPEVKIPVNQASGHYSYHFHVPAGVVQPQHCSTPYKLVATITYETQYGSPGPLAGYVDGPVLQFYRAS